MRYHPYLPLLLLLLLPAEALRSLSSRKDIIHCIITCEKQVSPCVHIKNTKCQRVYHECLKSNDAYSCMAKSPNKQLNAIAECFEKDCKPYEEPQPIPLEEIRKQERQRIQRYYNTPWKKLQQQERGMCGQPTPNQQGQPSKQGSCGGNQGGRGSCGGNQGSGGNQGQGSCGGKQGGGGKQGSCGGKQGSCGGSKGGCNKSRCGGSSFDAFFLFSQ